MRSAHAANAVLLAAWASMSDLGATDPATTSRGDCLVGKMQLVCLGVTLVRERLEDIPQIAVSVGQVPNLVRDIRDDAGNICGLELGKTAVQVKCLIQPFQHAAIVDDVAEVLALVETVYSGNCLEKLVTLHRATQARLSSGQGSSSYTVEERYEGWGTPGGRQAVVDQRHVRGADAGKANGLAKQNNICTKARR
ncbi:MAG: hypothetical protein AAF108_06695 [Planctomycetota bacterium]